MSSYRYHNTESKKDKIKSAVITLIIWTALLLFIFTYTVKQNLPKEKEIVTTMLVNFGDNRNGNGIEEPASQEGSLATKVEDAPMEEIIPETKSSESPEPTTALKKETPKKNIEKSISGNNPKISTPKVSSKENNQNANSTQKSTHKSSAQQANSKQGHGDGKGNATLGNFMKGRGTKAGSQGTGAGVGNAGDPLGGDGNGDSKIGVDRKLIAFIPGTMGRGGAQPKHSCKASGTISLSYTVNKKGNVIAVHRSGGVSDACIVSTSIGWIKTYVKAEPANFSSTGTYQITF